MIRNAGLNSCLVVGAEKKEVLETTLCGLNRIVVLEHPQMDVPWFHQQFATARLERSESLNFTSLEHEVLR